MSSGLVSLGVVPAKRAFDGFSNKIVIIIGAALILGRRLTDAKVNSLLTLPFIYIRKLLETRIKF